jgi:predicted MFS family arabinose efflux permease
VDSSERLAKNADFMKLWMGQAISEFGSSLGALPLFAILVLHASPAQMGILSAFQSAPTMLLSLFIGVWADRLRRRPLLLFADLGRAALFAALPLAGYLGVLRIETAYLVALLAGTLTVLFNIAYPSYLPALLQAVDLMEGNRRLGMSESLAEVAGTPLGYAVVQKIGAAPALLCDAFSFLCSAFALSTIRHQEPPPESASEHRIPFAEIKAGMEEILRPPYLRPLTTATLAWSFCGAFFYALYSLYGLRTLGIPPAALGVVIGLGGVGSFIGAALSALASKRLGLGRMVCGTLLIASCLSLLVPLAHGSPARSCALLGIAQVFGDMALTIYMIALNGIRQTLLPDRLRGRANAGNQFMTGIAFSLGSLTAGFLGQRIGLRAALLASVIGMILASIALSLSPARRLRSLEDFTATSSSLEPSDAENLP